MDSNNSNMMGMTILKAQSDSQPPVLSFCPRDTSLSPAGSLSVVFVQLPCVGRHVGLDIFFLSAHLGPFQAQLTASLGLKLLGRTCDTPGTGPV